MKKILSFLLVAACLFLLSACGKAASSDPSAPSKDPCAEEDTSRASPVPASEAALPPEENDPDAADVDLTQLSSTMVYSEVYAMVYEPEQYIGKTVKMRGIFATQEYNGERLYACIVKDATACCAQGLEFDPTEDFTYPDDFPADGETVRVIGVFDAYEEDGNRYLTLRDAVLEPVPED